MIVLGLLVINLTSILLLIVSHNKLQSGEKIGENVSREQIMWRLNWFIELLNNKSTIRRKLSE